MRETIALIVGILIASFVASTASAKINWADAKPVDAQGMVWLIVEHDKGLQAMFGIPESDGALLWMDCAGKRSLSLTYVDSTLDPRTRYRAYLKSGARDISVAATTADRTDLDDLVFLKTAVFNDKPFLANLKKGEPLALIVEHNTKGRVAAHLLPSHGSKLDRFFKACGV